MKAAPFRVTVLDSQILEEIPGTWTDPDFARLLERMEYGETSGMSSEELREMCVASLQDLKPTEAAALLLEERLKGLVNKGQIQTLSLEAMQEKLWEEHAGMPLHQRLFHVGSLLYQAFPDHAPTPDAVEVRLEVAADDAEGEGILAEPLHESLVARLLAEGMGPSAMINRLFDDSVAGALFPEAPSIVWIAESERADARTLRLRVVGSGRWLDPLRDAEPYTSSARADPPVRPH